MDYGGGSSTRVDTKVDFFPFAKYEINTKFIFILRNFFTIISRNFVNKCSEISLKDFCGSF
jgi:hypothetical protein